MVEQQLAPKRPDGIEGAHMQNTDHEILSDGAAVEARMSLLRLHGQWTNGVLERGEPTKARRPGQRQAVHGRKGLTQWLHLERLLPDQLRKRVLLEQLVSVPRRHQLSRWASPVHHA